MQKKKAVSLIVLVITIIVMIILAGTIVLTLNNSGIIEQAQSAVDETNLKEVQTLASLKWAEAFVDGYTTQEELEREVLKRLGEEKLDLTPYLITVTAEGVTVSKNWVVATVDGVPIPKGFVASSATGENTKNGGLVIYEGTTPVTDANVETAKRTRNQYVWVPVGDFSKFVRDQSYSNVLGTGYWEVVLDTATNMPLATQDTNYMTATTLAEVQAMYESVKEYKGFYIARYEAGIDTQRTSQGNAADLPGIKAGTTVYSVMGKIPYTYIPWTWNDSMAEDTNGAVEVSRRMYPATNTNYGAVSTLTYGVQWDTTLKWWLDTKAVSSVTDSTSYGNYKNHVINSQEELNEGALVRDSSGSYVEKASTTLTYPKASGTKWALSTGALKVANVNNIYDMAGNVREWTMEGFRSKQRFVRGGVYSEPGFPTIGGPGEPVEDRYTAYYYPYYARSDYGFRPSLYIKK